MLISKTNTENHLGPGNINVIFIAGFTSGHIRFSDSGVVQFPGFVPQNSLDYPALTSVTEGLGVRWEFIQITPLLKNRWKI